MDVWAMGIQLELIQLAKAKPADGGLGRPARDEFLNTV